MAVSASPMSRPVSVQASWPWSFSIMPFMYMASRLGPALVVAERVPGAQPLERLLALDLVGARGQLQPRAALHLAGRPVPHAGLDAHTGTPPTSSAIATTPAKSTIIQ